MCTRVSLFAYAHLGGDWRVPCAALNGALDPALAAADWAHPTAGVLILAASVAAAAAVAVGAPWWVARVQRGPRRSMPEGEAPAPLLREWVAGAIAHAAGQVRACD